MINESWVEKYRPLTVKECVLRESIAHKAKSIISKNGSTNLLLLGSPGTGKTCFIQSLINDLDLEDIWWESRKVESLRTNLDSPFTYTHSINKKKKVVVLDEFDHSTDNVQKELLKPLEGDGKGAGISAWFIIVNDISKINEAIISRTAELNFDIPANEKEYMLEKYIERFKFILEMENIVYGDDVLYQYVAKYFPGFRKIINELQCGVDVDNNLMPV